MRRREFITLVGGAVAARAIPARAQQSAMPVIGFLGASTPSSWTAWTRAFVQGLRELGWVEGRTVRIEYRWAEGQRQRYAEIAAEFVRLKVDVILTVGSAVPAAKQATATIPIVFALAVDPIASGLVASLARPGGNVTGFSAQSIDLTGKRIEILRELLPDLRRLAVIFDAGYSAAVLEKDEVQSLARKLGIEVDVLAIRRANDIAPAFETLKSGTQALYVCPGALVKCQPQPHKHPGTRRAASNDSRCTWLCRCRWAPVLWCHLYGPIPALRRVYRQNSQGRKASRSARRTTNQVRACHRSDNR